MNQEFEKTAEQAAAFQKIWVDSASKIMQAAFTVTPNSPPPEVLRQIRSGIFQVLADSWDEFMRSPQFLEGMKQWMESAINFRKISNDFLSKVRNEMQSPSRDDVDTLMVNIHHIEKRLLDRLDELSVEVKQLKERLEARPSRRTAGKGAAAKGLGSNRNAKSVSRTRKERAA
jgi:hypothetical protein